MGGIYMNEYERLINEIMSHLDNETANNVVRMSVLMDEEAENAKEVSHACCSVYGKTGNEIINLLDMYTDMNAGRPDNEDRHKS